MNTQKVLGTIVTGCVFFIAVATLTESVSNTIHRSPTINLPQVATKYTAVQGMPVAEVVEVDSEQLNCMALNMYFEARNQYSEEAMAAVGYTVMNRVASKRYPSTVCNVVFQGMRDGSGGYIRHKCQFSWVCDGVADRPITNHPGERKAWERAQRIAIRVMQGTVDNPVGNATMYHATYVSPYWKKAYLEVAQVEDHIFYERG